MHSETLIRHNSTSEMYRGAQRSEVVAPLYHTATSQASHCKLLKQTGNFFYEVKPGPTTGCLLQFGANFSYFLNISFLHSAPLPPAALSVTISQEAAGFCSQISIPFSQPAFLLLNLILKIFLSILWIVFLDSEASYQRKKVTHAQRHRGRRINRTE